MSRYVSIPDPSCCNEVLTRYLGFGTRRVPLETHYFEAYNHDNVRLVDVKNEDPIERITKNGILLKSGEHVELDVLIYATGFDAITGAFSAIDFRGEGGVKLTDVWSEGPRTFLGLFVHRFPNSMFPSPRKALPGFQFCGYTTETWSTTCTS